MTNAGARMNGIEVTTYAVRNEAEIVQAIEAFAREPGGGLIPLPSELIALKRELIISLAAKHRLPSIYAFRYYPESGGLASYGVDNIETIGVHRTTLTAFSKAKSLPIYRFSFRPSIS
jgi:putative tryptophan/tyrosine transport system substrate-binding protein